MLVQILKRAALLLLLALPLYAQTKVDWATQIKNKPWIDAKDYGVKGGALHGCLGIFSNASLTVTTGAVDPPVSVADIGSIFVASNVACAGNNGTVTGSTIVGNLCPPTCPTITGVTTAHQFTISALPSANAGDGTTCCMWAKGKYNDGPALQLAFDAATANCPSALYLPANKGMFIGQPIYETANICGDTGGGTYAEPGTAIEGHSSTLYILPNFDATAVTGVVGMLFGVPGSAPISQSFRNFSVHGLGHFSIVGGNNKVALSLSYGGLAENVGFSQWGTATPGFIAVYCSTASDSAANLINVGTYNSGFLQLGPYCYGDHLFNLTRHGANLVATSPDAVYTSNSQFYDYGGNFTAVQFSGTGRWVSASDSFFGKTNNSITLASAGSAYINQGNIVANVSGILPGNAGAIVHLTQTKVSGGTAAVNGGVAGSKIFDDCGNTMGTNGVWTNIALFGSCSVTGTALVAGNVGLTSGWDTSTISAVGTGSDSHKGTFTITAAGAPGLNPRITLTFPTPFWVAPTYCVLQQTGGTLGVLTVPLNSAGTPTTTAVTFDLAGTPVAAQTYTFAYGCP